MAIDITLPDGSSRALDDGATAGDLAAAIGRGLAKAAVVAEVNGEERVIEIHSRSHVFKCAVAPIPMQRQRCPGRLQPQMLSDGVLNICHIISRRKNVLKSIVVVVKKPTRKTVDGLGYIGFN